MRTAPYVYTTTREILKLYRAWAFSHQLDPYRHVPRGIGEAWYLDRKRADPVFPAADTEPSGERDKLWQAFIDEVAASDQPELRINLAILRLAQAARGEPRVQARHALQKALIDNAGCFRAAAPRTDFSYVWALAFPPLRVSKDKYETAVLFRRSPLMEINNGSYEGPFDVLYDRYALIGRNRGSFTPVRYEDVRTDAENACRFFLAITPEGRLRAPDVKALILPYVGFLTEDEARAVYQLAAAYRPGTAPPLVDAVALQQALGKRFPALLDEAHLAEVARRQADGQPPPNALIVSRDIRLPPCEGTERPRLCARRWADGQLWACWGMTSSPSMRPEENAVFCRCPIGSIAACSTPSPGWNSPRATSSAGCRNMKHPPSSACGRGMGARGASCRSPLRCAQRRSLIRRST